MKRNGITFSLIVFVMMYSACNPATTIVEVSAPLPETASENLLQTTQPVDAVHNNEEDATNDNSCRTPSPANASICAELEEQILATTVRIKLHRWQEENGERGEHIDGGIGHATVKDGRYLITHNHFPMPLDSIEGTVAGEQIRISIYKANGEAILDNALPSVFTIVAQDSETVVLDFGEYVDEGLLTVLGMASAEFGSWQTMSLAPGMEVAQINWDNETAHVEWATIKQIVTGDGTPYVELDNGVIKGSSGGGVFWNGIHIGNNWTNTTVQEATGGTLLDTFSRAALNSELASN